MIIIFLIVIILILVYFLLKNKDTFIIKNIIKGNKLSSNELIKYDNTNIFLGKSLEQDFITFDTQFHLKISVPIYLKNKKDYSPESSNLSNEKKNGEVDSKKCPNSPNNWVLPNGKCCDKRFTNNDDCINDYIQNVDVSYYLNNGNMCPNQISDSICFKRNSDMVSEALLLEGIPKKQTCIKSGCIPETFNDDYCCSKLSNIDSNCGNGYKNKSCVINNNDKKESDDLHEDESINYNINENTRSGLWKFIDLENKNDQFVYYGQEVLLQNISNITSFLCMCDSSIDTLPKCGKKVDIYCYNSKKDAIDYGRWIIIPKFFNKFSKDGYKKTNDLLQNKNKEDINDFNFYEYYEDDVYDFETLRDKKIPIRINDKFLIINSNKIDGKHYVYLNFCDDDDTNLYMMNCNGSNYKKVIGSFSDSTQLVNFMNNELYIYNWSIVPNIYDINVYDTLFVDGSITLGDEDPLEITSDTLRYIKNIPYHFDKEICLKEDNKMANCINKEHIEMLNGSRPINIKSVVPAKPFILYSALNYTGRELHIGFDYEYSDNLPYIGKMNYWMNPNDHGKWISLKIEGPYSAIIFNKSNYGYGTNSVGIIPKLTLDELKKSVSNSYKDKTTTNTISSNDNNDNDNNDNDNNDNDNNDNTDNDNNDNDNNDNDNSDKYDKNPTQYIVESPGIKNVRDLGDNWSKGIRSIIFRYKNKDGEYKEISSKTKSYEMKCLEKDTLLNQTKLINSAIINNNIYTANLCKNGNDKQNFYLYNDNDDKFVESNIYDDIDSEHIHFHKHNYDSLHEEL